jgi:hypothetical protein
MSQSRFPTRHARTDARVCEVQQRGPRPRDGVEYRRWQLYRWLHIDRNAAVNDVMPDGSLSHENRGPSISLHFHKRSVKEGAA